MPDTPRQQMSPARAVARAALFLGEFLLGAAITFYLLLVGGPGASEDDLSEFLQAVLVVPFYWLVGGLIGFAALWALRWRFSPRSLGRLLVVSFVGAELAIIPALAVDRAWVERELADTWGLSAPFRAAVKTHWERTGACPTLEELGLEALPPLTLLGRPPYYRNQADGGNRPPPSCEFGFMWTDGSDTGRFFWWPEEVYPAGRSRGRITSRGDWRFLWE